jgi:hypothetical protein
MSILKQNHSDPISPALRATTQIKNRAARLAETIIREWEHGHQNHQGTNQITL